MQLSPAARVRVEAPPARTTGPAVRSAEQALILPFLQQLSIVDNHARDRSDDREARLSQREEQERAALGAAANAPSAAEVINESERRMDPSSRAYARRQNAAEQAQQIAADRRSSRKALSDRSKGDARGDARPGAVGGKTNPFGSREGLRSGASTESGKAGETPGRGISAELESAAHRAAAQPRNGEARPGIYGEGKPAPPMPQHSSIERQESRTAAAARAAGAIAGLNAGDARSEVNASARERSEAGRGVDAVSSKSNGGGSPRSGADAARGNELSLLNAERRGRSGAANSGDRAGKAGRADERKDDAMLKQVMRVVRSRLSQKNSHIMMRLDPPSLGTLRIHMDLSDRNLTMRIDVDTHLARRLLTDGAESLRDALDASGVRLEKIEIRQLDAERPAQPFDQDSQADSRQSESGTTDGSPQHSDGETTDASGRDTSFTDEPLELVPEPATESSLNVLA